MERLLTAVILGLCAAPLFFVLTIKGIDALNSHTQPGQSTAFSASLFIGMGMVIAGFMLSGGVAWLAAGRGYLRPVQAITGLLVAGWGVAGAVFYWNEPYKLDYSGQKGVIDVEVRVAKSILGIQPPGEAITLSFTGGDGNITHNEQVRKEGDFLIVPWETTVTMVYNWSIWVTVLNEHRLYFPMSLPYRPTHSTGWSGWESPSAHKGATTPIGIMLRYRFRLVKV